MNGESEKERRVFTFAEEDYRFGAGSLRMTVERIDWDRPFAHEGGNWYEVHGIELTEDGRVIRRRSVLVRGARLTAWAATRRRP
nr:hypothetical protein [uncultured Actinoplanes sp.]